MLSRSQAIELKCSICGYIAWEGWTKHSSHFLSKKLKKKKKNKRKDTIELKCLICGYNVWKWWIEHSSHKFCLIQQTFTKTSWNAESSLIWNLQVGFTILAAWFTHQTHPNATKYNHFRTFVCQNSYPFVIFSIWNLNDLQSKIIIFFKKSYPSGRSIHSTFGQDENNNETVRRTGYEKVHLKNCLVN